MPSKIVTDLEFLRQPCSPCESTQEANKIIKKLWDTLKYYGGVGLAANQIGILKQVCVVYAPAPHALVNPVLTFASAAQEVLEERCLSLPGVSVNVSRPIMITIEADSFKEPLTFEIAKPINYKGKILQVKHWGAFIVQHEMDHLSGKLITDYATVTNE